MFKIILYLFLIGHMLGDFYLQSSVMAENKDKSSKELLKHCAWYWVAMMLVTIPMFSWRMVMCASVISIAHFIIDLAKFRLKGKSFMKGKETKLYIIDQVLHVTVVVITSWLIWNSDNQVEYIRWIADGINKMQIEVVIMLSWVLVILVIIRPASVTIRTVLESYRPESNEMEGGLPNAGALIGNFERFIILMLLLAQQYAAIGFVLTAKSVARYNKITENPKFSEYYLLGTLLSTLLVIVAYTVIF